MENHPEVAYLGPEGSFASLLARQRFPEHKLVPQPTIRDVVRYVQNGPDRLGIVPIENSSGGIIYDTVDSFAEESFNLYIREELGIHVNLALIGRRGQAVEKIYSHWVALKHCGDWLEEQFPGARSQAVNSTSEAASIAAREDSNAVAISTRDSASRYGLDVLVYPIQENFYNRTQFFVLGREPVLENQMETSIIVTLDDTPGALYHLLRPFDKNKVNLRRILSRNIPGRTDAQKFFIGIEGAESDRKIQKALKKANKVASRIRILGSYPRMLEPFNS